MDQLNLHDVIDIVLYTVGLIVTIAVVKTDVKWIKKWCADHKEQDDARFKEVREDLRELRDRHA